MAAIRAELPTKPLPADAEAAAPPCDVAFAPERVVVLTNDPNLGENVPEPKKETDDLSSQKGKRPNMPAMAEILSGRSVGRNLFARAKDVPQRLAGTTRKKQPVFCVSQM